MINVVYYLEVSVDCADFEANVYFGDNETLASKPADYLQTEFVTFVYQYLVLTKKTINTCASMELLAYLRSESTSLAALAAARKLSGCCSSTYTPLNRRADLA